MTLPGVGKPGFCLTISIINSKIMCMEKEEKLRRNIANNLIHYRKESNMTQLQLAEKLNYSDKAISKWERAESIPDIYTLYTLADLYNCTVDDLLSERIKVKRSFYKNRLIISLMSVALVWLVSIVVYMIWKMIGDSMNLEGVPYWITWFYALLASFIVAVVFSKIWGKRWQRFFFVSGIVWSTGLVIFTHLLLLSIPASWLVWCVCAAVQVLVFLWYCLIRKKKNLQ